MKSEEYSKIEDFIRREDFIREYAMKYTRSDVDGEIMMILSHILWDISRKEPTYQNAIGVVIEYMREYEGKLGASESIETADDFDEKGELRVI